VAVVDLDVERVDARVGLNLGRFQLGVVHLQRAVVFLADGYADAARDALVDEEPVGKRMSAS